VDAVQNRIDNKQMKFNDVVAHDDGVVEFEILSSIIHMTLNKSNRVAQEKGPITIHFKEPENGAVETYF
jgi:hypothetical protein